MCDGRDRETYHKRRGERTRCGAGSDFAVSGFSKTFKASNKNVKWNSINTDTSIGIYPLSGARYIKKYVSGSYTAQMPFQIVYRSSPTSNKTSIDAQMVLENLSKWLEDTGIEFADPHMTLQEIARTSVVLPIMQDEKQMGYGVNMQLIYFYKK